MKFSEYKYERPNIDSLVNKANTIIESINKEQNVERLIALITEYKKMESSYATNLEIANIRNSINTKDSFYDAEIEYLSEEGPKFTNASVKFQKALVEHPLRRELEKHYGTYWFKKMEMGLLTFKEEIMEDLVKEAKLSQEYSKLIASAEIEFEGKTYNLSQMSKFTQNKDREIRKAAAIAVDSWFGKNASRFDEIYDNLVHVRDLMARKLGYKNYVELGYKNMLRTDYDAKDVKGYRDQILKEIVPVANELRHKQMERIGIKNPEMFDYSLEFTDGNPTPHGTKDELVNKALRMYSEMSPETKEFFTFMLEHELMDLETKPGKMSGGYCTYIEGYKSPFIFSNFNQTRGDVDVLTHEAGHAFECYMASKALDNSDLIWPTYEACEIHSMSMEFFAYPWINLFFEEDTQKYKHSHISGALTFIPYGACVDEFQHYVYENPNVSPLDRKKKWRELERKYLPYRKYTYEKCMEEGSYWYRQGHIFASPFYYIDYTLAQVCALEFFLESQKDYKKAWEKYIKLCKLGGSESFLTLLKKVDLANPFVDGTIHEVIKELLPILDNVMR